MKAEIIIPKGWKKLRRGEITQEGDRLFWSVHFIWDLLHPVFYGKPTESRCIIRPIPKAAKPSPQSQPTKRKAK